MPINLADLRAAVAELEAQRAARTADLGVATSAVQLGADAVRGAAAVGDVARTSAAQSRLNQARQQRRDVLSALDELDATLISTLEQFVDDPCDAEPDVPLVLLPVRLETRFVDGGATLRVRIFPDDAHVDRLDAGLSDSERAAAVDYWTAVWTGGTSAEGAAWQKLAAALHPQRAAWAAWATTPTNLADRPDPGAATPAPVFPEIAARTLRPPLARLLPDRFVVIVTQAGATAAAVGEPIPSEVVVSLPRDDDSSALVPSGQSILGPGMEWFVDPDEAARIGLAVSVPLPAPGRPVDQVLAFGVRASLDPDASGRGLESLLTAQRFGSDMALLAQGTPTNNTEQDRADWSPRPAPTPPPTTLAARSLDPSGDAALLATALGVDPALLAGIAGSDLREQALTQAAHTALWGPSWATFLDRLAPALPESMFDDSRREALRDLFLNHVRGAGPLPAVRLGNQPYGVLPISQVDGAWVATDTEPLGAAVAEALRRLRPLFRAGLGDAPRLDGAGALDATLLDILGAAPQTIGLRVRSLASQASCSTLPDLLGLPGLDTSVQSLLDQILWESLGLPAGPGLGGVLGKTTRPLGLPLAADSDVAFFAGATTTVESLLQALVALARDQAGRAVEDASPVALAPRVLQSSLPALGELGDAVQALSERVLAGDRQPAVLLDAVSRVSALVGPAGPVLNSRVQPLTALRASLAATTLDAPLNDAALSVGAAQALQAWLRASAHQQQVEDAVAELAAASTERRRIATADVLDCSSHRFDAWTTALVSRRLAAMRTATATGCLIGGYGWVEGVSPASADGPDGGYLLAPSIPQAVTAGVLRSAYLHHNPDADGDNAFAVDLSSARVRAGRALLDGIRNGQPLGALLGYRFERMLQESPHAINRFVLSLRALAPLAAGKLTNRVEAPPPAAAEAVAATDVVDGIALIDAYRSGVDIRGALSVKPANNPYLSDPWPAPTDEEWAAITSAIGRLEESADAVSDLLMAEAVHQLVQGNTAVTAATLDAAAGGDAVPVDPLVTRIPARGCAVTYRVLTLIGDAATGPADGWRNSPRALAEPHLEAWARRILGPADHIVLSVAHDGTLLTLDHANLSAIDIVCDALQPAVLRARLEVRVPALTGRQLPDRRDDAWPAGFTALGETASLAAAYGRMLAAANPLTPAQLTRAGDRPTRTVAAADLASQITRLTAAAHGLAAAATDLETVAGAGPTAVALARAVEGVAAYGVPTPPATGTAQSVAAPLVAEARRRVDAATAALAAPSLSAAATAGHALFGDGFPMLPVVTAGPVDLFQSQFGASGVGPAALRRLVREVAAVRPDTARYADTLLIGDALARPRALSGVQLAALGAVGGDRWLGDGLAAGAPVPTTPVTCLVAETSGPVTGNGPVAGLVIDEWVEVLPARTTDPSGVDVQNVLTAGVAANVRAPDARAPQAILLALSPDGQRWSTDRVRALLAETLELAKLRTVTLEHVALLARLLPALQEQSWSLQGEQTLDLTTVMTVLSKTEHMLAFVKEAP